MTLINVLKQTDISIVSLYYDNSTQTYFLKKELSKDCLSVYTKIRSLKSKYIPEIYQIDIQDDKIIVLEEYIEAIPLSEHIELKTKFSKNELFKIAINTTKALCSLHKGNIIHRDIKPSNIMVLDDLSIKLIDFNASRNYSVEKSNDTILLGTRGYAPPEQFGFSQTDFRADIYSFGATLYELVNGQMIELSNFKYDGFLKNILQKCLQIDPKNRYSSTNELLYSLVFCKYKIHITILTIILCLSLGFSIYNAIDFSKSDTNDVQTEHLDNNYDINTEDVLNELDSSNYDLDINNQAITPPAVQPATTPTAPPIVDTFDTLEDDDIYMPAPPEEPIFYETIADTVISDIIEEDDGLYHAEPTVYYFTSGVEKGRIFISFPLDSYGLMTYPSSIPSSWITVKKADGTEIPITGDFYAGLNGDGILVVCLRSSTQISNSVSDFQGATLTFTQLNESSAIKYTDGRIFEGFTDKTFIIR